MKYLSNQKLWRIIREPEGYFYEIKLGGMVVDRIKVEGKALGVLHNEEVI